jgi:hypothetical protein
MATPQEQQMTANTTPNADTRVHRFLAQRCSAMAALVSMAPSNHAAEHPASQSKSTNHDVGTKVLGYWQLVWSN